jgi:NAD(P)-dependent dehydrogenase (short-subunit alcohol dehydrogenase family)
MGLLDRFRLDGKVAIITGASSGLGVAFATGLAEAGADIAICARRADKLEQTKRDVEALGRRCVAVTADVSKPEDCARVVEAAVATLGRVDVLVNNAGTSYANKSTHEVGEDEFDRVMSVNVKSVFLGSNAFAAQVKKQGTKGSMINIASVGAHRPRPGLVWYNASKGAITNVSHRPIHIMQS